MQSRPIPSSGELLPVIGGRVIDTSPMYGRAEEAVGELKPPDAFLATKVWTEGREEGIAQMERSFAQLGVMPM
jgi:diketogulonate reductase-like aldo/keto reductase